MRGRKAESTSIGQRKSKQLSFRNDGFLPSGVHDCTLSDLQMLVSTNFSRRLMWPRLISFLAWPIQTGKFSHAYIGGGFVSTKTRPRDIDVILQTVEPYGPSSFEAVSRFFLVGLEKIFLLYSIHLQFWMENAPEGMQDYRSFFQYIHPTKVSRHISNKCGIIRIDLRHPDIVLQFRAALVPPFTSKGLRRPRKTRDGKPF